jgi:putative SOS response-associated peptidase YedK
MEDCWQIGSATLEGSTRAENVCTHAREGLRTCVIITTAANDTLKTVHDRMPVIVPESKWAESLDPIVEETDALERLLVPTDDGLLDVYRSRHS